ncbi:MAG: hypothetical protein ABR915_20715 [Thermoguttaceae bacterium]|jgi:hypothetical protein
MDFQERLDKAIQRGRHAGLTRAQEEAQRTLSEKDLQRLHSQCRLQATEHIEQCLRQLADRFPGFRFETIVEERGWGAAIGREDLRLKPGHRRSNCFSRLEMVISPQSPAFILELTVKGTICNRELFNRTHFQRLAEVDLGALTELIDLWALQYAERYAAER